MKNLKTSLKSPVRKGAFAALALPAPALPVPALPVLALLAMLSLGCAGSHGTESKTDGATGTATAAGTTAVTAGASPAAPDSAPSEELVGKGPQLWADNCGRCHNTRSPSMYSDQQWEVVGMHMRVRANLTADDSREILAFLKNAH